MEQFYERLDQIIDDIFTPLAIILIVSFIGFAIVMTAKANAETPEPTKDWCYSYVSGQSMPMEYCDED
jgi:hypothetical protein